MLAATPRAARPGPTRRCGEKLKHYHRDSIVYRHCNTLSQRGRNPNDPSGYSVPFHTYEYVQESESCRDGDEEITRNGHLSVQAQEIDLRMSLFG
jgi:hypothetical protein